jgi:hypothetical protein
MKLSEASILCEGNNRAFAEVYKLFNFKDEDDLRAYTDFVMHEPVEWMRGFPAAWKSVTMFSKPRAAFHRLLKQTSVLEELGESYCEQVHSVVWNAFKEHMNAILEKRNGSLAKDTVVEESESVHVDMDENETGLTAESVASESDDELPPCPPVPAAARRRTTPKNNVVYTGAPRTLDYKQKFEVVSGVLLTLLSSGHSADENVRLRTGDKLSFWAIYTYAADRWYGA